MRWVVLLAATLCATSARAQPHAAADTVRVCIIRDTALVELSAVVRGTDTLIDGRPFSEVRPSASPPYAAGLPWFERGEAILLAGRRFEGEGEVTLPRELLYRVTTHRGVPVFAEHGRPGSGRIYVPVHPGCAFRRYGESRVPLRHPRVVVDTEETIWPDPVDRTYMRFARLRNLLEQHRSGAGRYPATLDTVLPHTPAFRAFREDAWGNTIGYLQRDTGFLLTSPGPDGLPDTADDLTFTHHSTIPGHRRAPEDLTAGVIMTLRVPITLFHGEMERLPSSLAELRDSRFGPGLVGVTDGWGRPIVFRAIDDSFELRSMGPDGEPNTPDDIFIVGFDPLFSGPADRVTSVVTVDDEEGRSTPCVFRGRIERRTYPPNAPPHADARPWYARAEPIEFGGRTLLRHGRTIVLFPEELQRVGTYDGIAVFAEAGQPPPHEVVYLPVSPGCEYRPYEHLTS